LPSICTLNDFAVLMIGVAYDLSLSVSYIKAATSSTCFNRLYIPVSASAARTCACGIIGLEGAGPGRPAHGTLADAPTGGLFRLPA